MSEKFDIEFRAKVDQFQKDAQAVASTIAQIGSDAERTGGSVDDFAGRINNAATDAGKLVRTVKDLSTSLTASGQAARGAASGYNNFASSLSKGAQASKLAADQMQRTNALARNMQNLPEQGRVGSSFGNIVDQKDKANQQASRSYHNLSTDIDSTIAARQRENAAASATIRARMQEAAVTDKSSKAVSSFAGQVQNLPRLRYALYDVSSAFTLLGVGLTALAVAPLAVAISWQKAFADVQRTVGGTTPELDALRQSFVSLSQEIPVSFSQLSEIGSLAGQLNVPTKDVADFTETVAKFGAVTGVSLDTSATALARLAQLLPPTKGGFESLGSMIVKTGVNSIATEQQIISLATQLAPLGTLAGMTSDQVIALSSAMASLGIAPEMARGTITRLFVNISRAVAEGGDKLVSFGNVSGKTASQFASDWKTNSSQSLVELLKGIGSKGDGAIAAMTSLGIVSARDVPTVLRLAQNTGLYVDALKDTASQVGNSAELTKQYGVISETVASKIKVLGQNVQALFASVGSSATGIGGAIDFLNSFLQTITAISQDPFWSIVATAGIGIALLTGMLALLAAGMARTAASVLAMRTAMEALNLSTLRGTTGLASMIPMILGTGTTARIASVGVKTLGLAMKAVTIAGLALVAIDIAGWVASWNTGITGGKVDSDALTESISKNVDASKTLQKTLSSVGYSTNPLLKGFISDTDAAKVGVTTLGSQVDAFFNNSVQQRSSPFTGLYDQLNPTRGAIEAINKAFLDTINSGHILEANTAFIKLRGDVVAAGGDVTAFNMNFQQVNDALYTGTALMDAVKSKAKTTAQETAAAFAKTAEDIKRDLSSAFDPVTDISKIQDALSSLGQSLAEGGNDWSQYSDAGRQNIGNILNAASALAAQTPNDTQATANSLQGLFDAIVRGGYASAQQLGFLKNAIAALGGSTASTGVDMSSFANGFSTGMVKVQKSATRASHAAKSAAKEIRTLSDYASDLSGVMKRAFDIRFSSGTAMDSVITQWQTLNDTIAENRAKVLSLTADRSVQKYFLGIANAYGDTLRSGTLTAGIADLDTQIADAASKSSTELTGNSKAAVTNRRTLLDLVNGYQDYIGALASSGASQDTLNAAVNSSRTEFIGQAQALGYSNAQLQPYIASFRDMTTVINNVPRNITVTASTDPALQALKEFMAKTRSTIGGGVNLPVTTSYDNSGAAKAGRAADLQMTIAKLQADYARQSAANQTGAANYTGQAILSYSRKLASGNFKSGGYTGDGGTSAPAGVVHGKEFVFTAQATKNAGVGNLYAMQRALQAGRGMQSGGYAGSSAAPSAPAGTMVVALDMAQYKGLVESGQVTVQLGNQAVANATNNANKTYASLGRG